MPHVAQPDRVLLRDLRQGFENLQEPLRQFREELMLAYQRGGMQQVRSCFDVLWRKTVGQARRQEYLRQATNAAARRLTRLDREIERRYKGHVPVCVKDCATRAVHQAMQRGRGQGAYRYSDERWPLDRWLKVRFLITLDDWSNRLERAKCRQGKKEIQAEAEKKPKRRGKYGPNATPRIDPKHRRIAYPWEEGVTDLSEQELVERALDDVVIARGEYFVTAGLRDLVREVDTATALLQSNVTPVIIGWRWTLSPAHGSAPSSPDICDVLAGADVGHPYGGGIYFDEEIPQSHPACWCSQEAVWATREDAGNPEWKPPEPPPGYSSRVRALVEGAGGTMLSSAA